MASPQRKVSQDEYGRAANGEGKVAMPAEKTRTDDPTKPLRIGEMLKRERERRGYDLQQIADYLCIRRTLLVALENSRYQEFPADAYAIGFLRSYAELLGMQGKEAVDRYRSEMAGRRRQPDLVLPTPVGEARAPTAVIMGAAALATLLIYVLWYSFSTANRATVSAPTLPAATLSAPAAVVAAPTPVPATVAEAPTPALTPVPEPTISTTPAPNVTHTVTPAAETISANTPSGISIAVPSSSQQKSQPVVPAPAAASVAAVSPATIANSRVIIKADQSSWVLIATKSGETVYDHVMKPGETYAVPDTPGLQLTTGNGAGIQLMLDGVDLPRLSLTTSHIVRNVPLDPGMLRTIRQPTE